MLIKVFEITVLVIIILVLINIFLNETKEEKEIARLFNRILVIAYIITIVVALICNFVVSTGNARQENEIVIEIKED